MASAKGHGYVFLSKGANVWILSILFFLGSGGVYDLCILHVGLVEPGVCIFTLLLALAGRICAPKYQEQMNIARSGQNDDDLGIFRMENGQTRWTLAYAVQLANGYSPNEAQHVSVFSTYISLQQSPKTVI
jgi:hypothetical protein